MKKLQIIKVVNSELLTTDEMKMISGGETTTDSCRKPTTGLAHCTGECDPWTRQGWDGSSYKLEVIERECVYFKNEKDCRCIVKR